MRHLFSLIGVVILLLCYCGCGRDDAGDGSVADAVVIRDTMPAITIEKVQSKALKGGIGIWWQLHADPAPKEDLAISLNDGQAWAVIPKAQHTSEIFYFKFYRDTEIRIDFLPMISVVGKGPSVNIEALGELPKKTLSGHVIPKDYEFQIYAITEPGAFLVKVSDN